MSSPPPAVHESPAAATTAPTGRLSALDSSRALLMLLGLWVHAAGPYREPGRWLVNDPAGSVWLHASSMWISEFRMPAFFVLAGLLSTWALRRHSGGPFLGRRAQRLLLPLVVVALTVNVLQASLLDARTTQQCIAGAPCPFDPAQAPWLVHLWFLLDLFVYTALLLLVAPQLLRLSQASERLLARLPAPWRTTLLVLAPIGAYCGWKLGVGLLTLLLPPLDVALFGFWSFSWVAGHFYFFVAGAFLAGLPTFRAFLARPVPPAIPIVSGLCGTAALGLRSTLTLSRDSVPEKIVFALAEALPTALLTVFAISACLALHEWLRPLASRLARWSYSIYLFHHFAVVALAIALLDTALPPAVKFVLVLAGVALFSTVAAQLVERSRWLSLLFNGETWVGGASAGRAAIAVPVPAAAAVREPLHEIDLEILERPAAPATGAGLTAGQGDRSEGPARQKNRVRYAKSR